MVYHGCLTLEALRHQTMKRVLLTVHKFFPQHRGGTEVLTLKAAQELKRRGFEVLVVAGNPPDTDARRRRGQEVSEYSYEGVRVRVFEEPLRLKGYTFGHEYFHPGLKRHFSALIAEFSPDLIHVFHCQNLSASIIEAALNHSVPVVCSLTDFWFVCPVVQLKRPDGSLCRGPAKLALNCLTCYTPRLLAPANEFKEAVSDKYPGIAQLLSALPKAFADAVWSTAYRTYGTAKLPEAIEATVRRPKALRNLLSAASAIMVPTRLMRDIFIENGIQAELLHHVPFGIDTSLLVPYQEKTESDLVRIGFIGTLFEHKGTDLLISAFQNLPMQCKAVLKIYGDLEQFPEYGRRLVELASRSSPHSDKICFAGTFPNDRLGEVLSSLDVLVVPSRWYENTPLVIQSAFATRTPVIATDLGGMSELVHHEVNGLLFQLDNVESLRDQLWRVIDDRSFLKRLREGIKPERTMAEMVDDIERVYESSSRTRLERDSAPQIEIRI